jgi:putative DNA primase/helicase
VSDFAKVEDEFRAALEARGIMAPAVLVADGQIHHLPTHDKPKAKNGRYTLHLDAKPAGYIENMGDGQGSQSWKWGGVSLSVVDLDALNAKIKADGNRRAKARAAAAELASISAKAQWEAADRDCTGHAYLSRKRVAAYGLRRDGDRLLVPLRNASGDLRGLQTIFAEKGEDGTDKRFGKGVAVTGCYHSFGKVHADNVIAIVEGFATGASVHAATGWPVAVAFDCGNLLAVTQALRAKFPDARLVVCCDDDWKQKAKNPGKVKGEEAAGKFGGVAVLPIWPPGFVDRGSDFNDLACQVGADAVLSQLQAALKPTVVDAADDDSVEAPTDDGAMWAPKPFNCSPDRGVTKSAGDQTWLVSRVPLWVAGVRVDSSDDSHALVLRWHRPNGADGFDVRQKTVDRSVVLNSRKIVDLQSGGFPVDTGTAAAVVEYLSACEVVFLQQNARAAAEFVSSVTGWHGSDDWQAPAFLFGRDRFGVNCPYFEAVNAALSKWVGRYSTSGSADVQLRTLQRVIDHSPDLATVIAVAMGSPLLRVLGAQPFVLDICSGTSQGKTKALRVAASVGGSPDAVLSWDSTPYALELHVNAVRGLSVCIDETQRAKVEAVQKTVYDLTTDTGKMRGAQNGGVRSTSRYESLVLSTGEQSISDFGEAGGARARVLTMWGPPWSRGSAAQRVSDSVASFQRDVIDTLTDNHGHAGRVFAGYVAGLTTEERRDLRARYRTLCNAASAEVEATSPGHPIGSRLAEYVAFLRVVGEVADQVLGLRARDGWLTAERWSDMMQRSRPADVATAAMARLVDWSLSRSLQLSGHPDNDKATRDLIGVWYSSPTNRPRLAVVVSVANDALKSAGFQIGAVTSAWAERGWVEGAGGSKVSKTVAMSGGRVRAYALTEVALSKFLWADDAPKTKGAQVVQPPPDDEDLF